MSKFITVNTLTYREKELVYFVRRFILMLLCNVIFKISPVVSGHTEV